MINPLLFPSQSKIFAKRTGLVLLLGMLGPLWINSQAANRPNPQPVATTTPPVTPIPKSPPKPTGKLVLVPPGTVIGTKAPQGWSHLVLKSLPRIDSNHRNRVSASTFELSRLVFTTIVARVEAVPQSQPTRYVLGDIGVGQGTQVNGKHIVLSPSTQSRFANLGFQERIVISECYKKLTMARSVVRTDSMAVIDTHAVMIRGGRHRLAKVRYAILLDPRSGKIATLTWGVDLDSQGQPVSANTSLEWLPPNKVDDLVLYVDPNQFTLGIPNDLAFAVNRAPQGHSRIALTRPLALLAGRPAYTLPEAQQLETTLRNELVKIMQQSAQRAP